MLWLKSNLNHFVSSRMAPKHVQLQVFTQANISVGKRLKNDLLVIGCFKRYFIRQPPAQDNHFWVGQRVVVLYSLEVGLFLYISIYIYIYIYLYIYIYIYVYVYICTYIYIYIYIYIYVYVYVYVYALYIYIYIYIYFEHFEHFG